MNGADLERFLGINPDNLATMDTEDWRRYVLITMQDIQRFLNGSRTDNAPAMLTRIAKLESMVVHNQWLMRLVAGTCIAALLARALGMA